MVAEGWFLPSDEIDADDIKADRPIFQAIPSNDLRCQPHELALLGGIDMDLGLKGAAGACFDFDDYDRALIAWLGEHIHFAKTVTQVFRQDAIARPFEKSDRGAFATLSQ